MRISGRGLPQRMMLYMRLQLVSSAANAYHFMYARSVAAHVAATVSGMPFSGTKTRSYPILFPLCVVRTKSEGKSQAE